MYSTKIFSSILFLLFLISACSYDKFEKLEMDANNYMRNIGYSLYSNEEKRDGVITVTSPETGAIIPKGIPLMIEWDYIKEGAIINSVDAYWLLNNQNEWNVIEKGIPNHQSWFWNIPEDFTPYNKPIIIYEDTSTLQIHREPNISIIPSLTSKVIDASSFTILNEGYFISQKKDTSINIILEMKDDLNRSIYTGDNDIYLNITNYKIDIFNPVWVDPSSNIIFPGTIGEVAIDIHIANSTNNDVFGVVKNLIIV